MIETLFNKKDISAMIPHQGEMCLLDGVIQWDKNKLQSIAYSHQKKTNPLIASNQLNVINCIEYAGQTVAVHRYLLNNDRQATVKQGYLAAVKNVKFFVSDLQKFTEPLLIAVECSLYDAGKAMYTFTVISADQMLSTGNLIVTEGQ